MKHLQQLSRILKTNSCGDTSSKFVGVGVYAIHQLKHSPFKGFVSCSFGTFSQHPASSVNLVESLLSRNCSGLGLAARYGRGVVPRRSVNLFPDGIWKLRHCSRHGLAWIHSHGTSSFQPTNSRTGFLSDLLIQDNLQQQRHCSRNTVAVRWDFSKSSNRDTYFLTNSIMKLETYFPKRRFCSRNGLVFSHSDAVGSRRSTNKETPSMSNPCHVARLWRCRQCSTTGLVSSCSYGTGSKESTDEDSLTMSNPSLRAYLEHLVQEHQQLSREMLDDKNAVDPKKLKRLRKRLTELTPLVEKIEEWTNKQAELTEIEELISGASGSAQDKEMKELAILEKDECLEDAESLEQEILSLLIPVEETDDNDIIIEFSAGVGGQEAMLFTADMFEMYERFATYRNWDFQKLEYFPTDLGGLRHASVSVSGDGAYKLMKHEAGVHRVQRVPKTEKAGRIHTSTMAVAVLPQPKEIDLKLDPKDLRIETKKASGAGGQHVNTTDSAVRIVHLPTGMAAESQQERSQLKNRHIAMVMLQTKIYNSVLEKQEATERSMRRSQVGSSGRSEKIRTYNFQQDRVTDHRIGQSVFDVEGFLSGGERLDEMISSLVKDEEKEMVARMLEEFEKSQNRTS